MYLINKNKKKAFLHKKCEKDFFKLSSRSQESFSRLFDLLERDGRLEEPEAKKLAGYKNLYELRIFVDGNWRMFYGYLGDDLILMAHLVSKKSQKTLKKDINLSLKRLKEYEKN